MDLESLKNDPEQIKALIQALSSLLPTDTVQTTDEKDSATENLFDKMMEKNLHKEDIEIDKKLSRYPPTERNRPFEFVEVKCRCCGTMQKVHPSLAFEKDRYKCNRCTKVSG
jgi:hypothetical protein